MDVVLKYLGYVLILFSFMPILPFVSAIILHEDFMLFFVPSIISLFVGFLLLVLTSKAKGGVGQLTIQRSIALTALSFMVMPLLGSLPFMIELNSPALDCIFESYSGFTTTGLTVLGSLEDIPRSLLLWRAETQWIGGLGIVLFALLVILRLRERSPEVFSTRAKALVSLYRAQGATEKLEPSIRQSVKKTILIYLTYTFLGAVLLFIAGMGAFEGLSMAMTSVSTGGFIVWDTLNLDLASMIVLSLLMIIGATSFVIHNRIFRLDLKEVLKSYECRVFAVLIVAASLLSVLALGDIKSGIFHAISAITTTGYALADISAMPYIAIVILACCMIIGGAVGSTAGGIKVLRFGLLMKSIHWTIRKISNPSRAVITLKVEGKEVEQATLVMAQVFVFLYILVLFVGTMVLLAFGNGFLDSSFQMVSALGTVGLQTIPALASLNAFCKIVLIIAMVLGRLEIFPVLVLFKFFADKAKERLRKQKY
ncbi:MAG: TrkH family potassium uptake protein [Candidatus Woesearchaeota archaeon]